MCAYTISVPTYNHTLRHIEYGSDLHSIAIISRVFTFIIDHVYEVGYVHVYNMYVVCLCIYYVCTFTS